MSFLFANEWAAGFFLLLGLILIVGGVSLFVSTLDERDNGGLILGAVVTLLGLAALVGWYWSSTHFVVKANERAIIVSKQTGIVSPTVLTPGVQYIS